MLEAPNTPWKIWDENREENQRKNDNNNSNNVITNVKRYFKNKLYSFFSPFNVQTMLRE